jgi:hypothetical protein
MFKKLTLAVSFIMLTSLSAIAQPIVTESTNNSTSTNTSTNTNTNNNNSRTYSDSTSTVKSPPPTAVAPSVTSINNDVCAVVASGAVQTQIFGFSMGGTMRDMNCERIKLSKNLFDMGMKVAAVATLCQDERVFAAMMAAGTPCPIDGKIGNQAREEWEKRGVKTETEKIGFYAVQAPKENSKAQVEVISTLKSEESGCDYTGEDPVVMARICDR